MHSPEQEDKTSSNNPTLREPQNPAREESLKEMTISPPYVAPQNQVIALVEGENFIDEGQTEKIKDASGYFPFGQDSDSSRPIFAKLTQIPDSRVFIPIPSSLHPELSYFAYGEAEADDITDKYIQALKNIRVGGTFLIRSDRLMMMQSYAERIVYNLFHCSDKEFIKGKHIVFCNPAGDSVLSIHRALQLINQPGMVLLTKDEPWTICYIGTLPRHLSVVINYLYKHGKMTSKDIKVQLDEESEDTEKVFTLGDIGRRLKDLYEKGLIKREPSTNQEGKLTYNYTVFHPWKECHRSCPSYDLRHEMFKSFIEHQLQAKKEQGKFPCPPQD